MFAFPISHRLADRASARQPRVRRPLVEELEGRLLLSGIQGRHIGTSVVPAIVGNHIGTSAGVTIVGNHIGMSVNDAAKAVAPSDATYKVRFYDQN